MMLSTFQKPMFLPHFQNIPTQRRQNSDHNYFYSSFNFQSQQISMSQKEEKKSLNEYDELKDTRNKSLIKQFQDYLINLKFYSSMKNSQYCTNLAYKDGQIDEIDEKVCLKAKEKELNVKIMRILPELTQHANNYEQCLNQCAKNHISYVVANQSCKAVYEKNFRFTTTSITERLLGRKQF